MKTDIAPPGRSALRGLAKPGRKPGVRERAAQETQDAILRAATRIFAKHGFSGGRVEQISKAAKSHDRMIYYYFGSKEGLYIAVLENLYRRFNEAEAALKLNADAPEQALVAVIGFIWTYYQRNPEFITGHAHPGHGAGQRRGAGRVSRRRFGARSVPDDRQPELLLPVQPSHAVGLFW